MQGKIVSIMMDKPFGFIAVEGQTKDLFFHANEMKSENSEDREAKMELFRALGKGDVVEFELAETMKGPAAQNVVLVQKASVEA